METKARAHRIRFGHCTLDEGLGVLFAPDGTETLLRPKTLELLRLLLRNAGQVVTRDEIMEAAWPGVFVTDDSITQCVVELRKAMGKGGAGLLRTLYRRGYLLQAEVAAERSDGHAAGDGPAGLPGDRPSIAVLPFRRGVADPQEAYFADGIIEGIVHVLSGLERIVVVSRGSSLAVAETTVDPRDVGRALSVRYVLYGGVRRAGKRLRITTELSETDTGAIIRSDRYEGDVDDLFALQDLIAERVVTTIAPEVRQRELARAMRKPPASLTAYELVLRALDEMRQLDRAAMERGRALLEQAIAADPGHGLAYGHLGWWYVFWVAQGWSDDIAADQAAATRATSAALERDRNDCLALTARGLLVGHIERDFDLAERLFDQAVAASPSCALAWSGGAALRNWRDEGKEAVAWAERAVRLAPVDPFAFLHEHILAQAHYTAGNWEQAIAWGRTSIASNPRHQATWRALIASLVAASRMSEAHEAAQRLLELDPGFSLRGFALRTTLPPAVRVRFFDQLRQAGLPE
ncbi:winged helix-turn-helix domain-containing protein [Falsiroseomonas sp.]|uniref:winged helix-turn-helix domain-containing protein n=1 Tax=Falsiroseomonas sp. TaxID=2870721 RepID=UPI0027366FFD|nr:winged helix-turn-helix domain-containing protein [Falsiroseomonas sp.]MDP3416669.1 winged helix-turn-helix domain-containing protein [Falsiroseomonas sp.]